jgi:hypothetical protein
MTDFFTDIVSLQARFSKTVSESDIYIFAGITGDFSVKSGSGTSSRRAFLDISPLLP